jgi:hypothetical protein
MRTGTRRSCARLCRRVSWCLAERIIAFKGHRRLNLFLTISGWCFMSIWNCRTFVYPRPFFRKTMYPFVLSYFIIFAVFHNWHKSVKIWYVCWTRWTWRHALHSVKVQAQILCAVLRSVVFNWQKSCYLHNLMVIDGLSKSYNGHLSCSLHVDNCGHHRILQR